MRELPYFLHAEGVLHFNRGALSEAETALRKAAEAQPDLDNFIALVSVLHRLDRDDEIKAIVDGIDLETVQGTPGQKMFLAQVIRKLGDGTKALQYAYNVLQSARNDQKAALRYFGLIMMDTQDGLIPSAEIVTVDTWVRLESDQHDEHAFVIEEGKDRPAEDVLSPSHPTAAASLGRRVGDEFNLPAGSGRTRRWRVAEVKHKYLHVLHDVMENFEKRFPDAQGLYKITMQEGDIQPALDEVRRVAENDRKLADLYLNNNFPINLIVSRRGGDTIRFVEYLRFLDNDIRTCAGTEAERFAARELLKKHKDKGAVLDTYTAWTVATMDALDVLKSVFGSVIVPQSVIDELKNLRDEQELTLEGSMTVGWHNGQFIRQDHSADDIAKRRSYIVEQLARIEAACEVRPVVVANHPSELATLISHSFGSHVLDAANLAGADHILVSEDMHFRQFGQAACSAKGVWLQSVFSFAREQGIVDRHRYVDLVVSLAWRRHGHLALDAETMLEALRDEPNGQLENFTALANFIGSRDAELRSHVEVFTEFLNRLWREYGNFDLRCMQATSVLLDRILRYRTDVWALLLAFIKRGCTAAVQRYVDGWIAGHFLSPSAVAGAAAEIENVARSLSDGRGTSNAPAKARLGGRGK